MPSGDINDLQILAFLDRIGRGGPGIDAVFGDNIAQLRRQRRRRCRHNGRAIDDDGKICRRIIGIDQHDAARLIGAGGMEDPIDIAFDPERDFIAGARVTV